MGEQVATARPAEGEAQLRARSQKFEWWARNTDDLPVRTVSVSELLFTHDSIGSCFTDGRTFQALLQDLRTGIANPLTSDFLCLTTLSFDGQQLFSLANRRLWCLKWWQMEVPWPVQVRVKVKLVEDPVIRKFLLAFTSNTLGAQVSLRQPARNWGQGSHSGASRQRVKR